MNRVVALAGPDGAGKSTVSRLLVERLAARRVDRWDIVGNPDYPTASCLTSTVAEAKSCAAYMSTTPRLLFLMWATALALTDRVAAPDDELLVLDGYWMKHAASEVAYGADPAWVEAVAAGLPAADLVVYMRLDPEVAWRRKEGRPVPYECGMDMSCAKSSFLAHQQVIRTVLDGWARRYGWLTVEADQPLEAVVDRLARELDGVRT